MEGKNQQNLYSTTLKKTCSIKDFISFYAKNAYLVWCGIFTILLVFGIRLGSGAFGVDTELYLSQKRYINWIEIGRFGLVFLQKITSLLVFHEETFNPWLATALACTFLLLGTLVWIYFFDFFSCGKIKIQCYIPFLLLFITNQVWCEQIYFVCQSAECMLIIALASLSSFFIFNGLLTSKKIFVAVGFFLSVFCVSVYQGVIVLIGCGILSFFVLFKKNAEISEKNSLMLGLKSLFLLIGILIVYFVLNKIVLALTHTEKSSYLANMLTTNKEDGSLIKTMVVYIYKITFANFPPVQKIAEPIMAKVAKSGWKAVEAIREKSLSSSILLPVATILFIAQFFRTEKKSVITCIAGICIPLSILALPMLGSSVPLRAQYVLPFAFSFMILYLVSYCPKRVAQVLAVIAILVAARQAVICAMLNYASVKTYESDVRLSSEVSERLYSLGVDSKTPVLMYGSHKSPEVLHGETTGFSSFEWNSPDSKLDATERGLAFMKTHGYSFTALHMADEQLLSLARQYAEEMPDFPVEKSVQNFGDVAVIRFSDTTFEEK